MMPLAPARLDPVLVVGTDSESVELIQLMLDMTGFPVLLARTAELAQNLLQTHQPWLLLLDMSRPSPDVERFRLDQLANPDVSGIPAVVVCPRYIGPIVADRLRAAELLEAPVELSEVTAVVRALAKIHAR